MSVVSVLVEVIVGVEVVIVVASVVLIKVVIWVIIVMIVEVVGAGGDDVCVRMMVRGSEDGDVNRSGGLGEGE